MHKLLFVVFLFIGVFCAAQDYTYEERDGKVFIVHIVEGGNTLYGLKSTYQVEISEIVRYNPTVQDGLQVGQRIFIPTDLTAVPNGITPKGKEHIVQKQETLFGISRQYNCSVDDLLAANPAAADGIKVGQVLLIPVASGDVIPSKPIEQITPIEQLPIKVEISPQDSIVRYAVQQKETLYSISKRFMVPIEQLIEVNNIKQNRISFGDTLIIPVKKESNQEITVKELAPLDRELNFTFTEDLAEKETYVIAFLVPFKIDANPRIITEIYDDQTRLHQISEIAVDFWLGAKMAIDSLESLGLKAVVHVFDTQGDLEKTKAILNKEEVLNADLIFGPFLPAPIEYAAAWAKSHKKFLIIPVAASSEILRDNPFVHVMVPSELTLIGGMAKYLAANHIQDKIVLINGRTEEEKKRVAFFELVFNQFKGKFFDQKQLIKMDVGATNGRDLANQFDLSGVTIFVCLAEEPQGVMRFINALNAAKNISSKHGESNVIVYGLRSWHNLSALNSYYKNRFTLHTAMPNFLDYNEAHTKAFTLKYRAQFNNDPSRFSFQGFDVVFFKINEKVLNTMPQVGYMNKFQIQAVGDKGGKENSTAFIVKQNNYELQLAGIAQNAAFLSKQSEEETQTNEGKD